MLEDCYEAIVCADTHQSYGIKDFDIKQVRNLTKSLVMIEKLKKVSYH